MIQGLYSILIGIDVILAIGVIALVLLQHGKGADAGAAFGSGASSTIFGAQGSTSFLSKMTGILAALFFINSLGLAYLAAHRPATDSVIDIMEIQTGQESPVLGEDADTSDKMDSDVSQKVDDAMQDGSQNSGASDIPEDDFQGEIPEGDGMNIDDMPADVPVGDIPDKF